MKKDYIIIVKQKKDKTQIVIEGNLGMKNIEKLKTQLETLLNKDFELEIIVKKVTDVDLSFLQLLLSINKVFKNKMNVDMSLSQELENLVSSSGFNDLPGMAIHNLNS